MALDSTKWQVRTDKSIRYIGGAHGAASANYISVLELHRWLQDLADDASMANDDYLDITNLNPSDKKFDTIITLTNGYTLDDAYTTPASEFIFGGSIIQGSGGTEVIYDGVSVVANRGVVVNVIQNNAVLSNKFWNNTPNGESFAGINPDPSNGVAMRFMVKIKATGAFIDNGSLIFTTREWGKTFSEFRIPSTGRGVNVVPLTYADDLNNTTASGTVATWTTITNVTSGWNAIDVNADTTDEYYYSEWNRDTYTINQFYERMKYSARNGEITITLYGIPGERFRGITHAIDIQAGGSPGDFVEGGATPLSWGSGATAGTAQILANDTTAEMLYVQLLTGVVPGNAVTVTQGANSATTAASNAVTEKALSAPFCGQSTGSSLVGAYGFALEYADLAVNDKITALDGTTRQPPNNVTFTVGGVANGWRVLVGPEDGSGGLLYTQLSNTNVLSGAAVTSVVVDEAIPANTPASGTIRIQRADGSYTRHPYSAVNTGTKTFTITSHNFSTNNASAGANIFISYIDAAASGSSINFNTVQTGNQTLYVEARFGGTGPNYTDSIKPAKTTGSLGVTGGSATVSSVSDA
jgi:hypothetical protein